MAPDNMTVDMADPFEVSFTEEANNDNEDDNEYAQSPQKQSRPFQVPKLLIQRNENQTKKADDSSRGGDLELAQKKQLTETPQSRD